MASWDDRFDIPIVLPDGTRLNTLRDAIQHLGKTIPKAEYAHPAVVLAATKLSNAASGKDLVMLARIATMRALRRHDPPTPFDPDRKSPGWNRRRRLKRDR